MFDGLINTLNTIEVHGKDNLDKLLGCILVLEQLNQTVQNKLRQDSEQNTSQEDENIDG